MAGEWLKWSKGLTRKPEILKIAARLMMKPTEAAGTLLVLMEWLDDATNEPDYTEDGDAVVTLGALPITFIDGLVGVQGWAEAMAEVGWLKSDNGGKLLFIHAARHNGKTAKARALARDRMDSYRSSKVIRSSDDQIVTPSLSHSSSEKEIGGEGGKSGGELTLFPDAPARPKSFSPPSPQEVAEYSLSIGYPLNGQAWCDSYAQKGWMVGKSKMKDWRAAVRNWKANGWQPSAAPAGNSGQKPIDIYTAPPDWQARFQRKYPNHVAPATWNEVPPNIRGELAR